MHDDDSQHLRASFSIWVYTFRAKARALHCATMYGIYVLHTQYNPNKNVILCHD